MSKSFCVVVIGLFLSFATAGAFAAQPQSPLANVTIAYTSTSPQYAPAWIAKETEIFRKYGVNAQPIHQHCDRREVG